VVKVNYFHQLPNPPAALGPGIYSTPNRNEYQRQKLTKIFVRNKEAAGA
jgi:hypothetical protein